jgi:hypothetical protein
MKFNYQHHFFPQFGAKWFYQILDFFLSGVQKPSIGHFGHIQHKAHVGLF